MRKWAQIAIVGLLGALSICTGWAHQAGDGGVSAGPSLSRTSVAKRRGRKSERALSSEERKVVVASALRSKTPRSGERDCSHLVHAVYQRAGFSYAYATSDDLYEGLEGFQRVSRPKAADLVVWRGHVGIVIRPSRHMFFSYLHAGPGMDDYRNRYWKGRGQARFYRYLKDAACAGCTVAGELAGP